MKILTITLHSTSNAGSSLQAYALQKFLLNNGFDTELIDYRPSYVKNDGNRLKTILKRIIFFKKYGEMLTKSNEFIGKYLKLHKTRYTSYKKLVSNPPLADIYITGSDQLWNSDFACGKDKAFYLGFAKSGKKMSYAVSLGKENVSHDEANWIAENVRDFDFVSVREYTSKVLLEENGIKNIEYVCDPVLLLEKEEYLNIQIKPQNSKYIAVYMVEKSDLLDNLLQRLKAIYGYETIHIGAFINRSKSDNLIKGTSPTEFVGLLANAEFIVASSFHATVFAHIFEKNFAIIPPRKNSARIEQFLELTGLTNHIVRSDIDIENSIQNIDYELVNQKLAPFVDNSKKILLNQLALYDKNLKIR